jgi:hypothetical protein
MTWLVVISSDHAEAMNRAGWSISKAIAPRTSPEIIL